MNITDRVRKNGLSRTIKLASVPLLMIGLSACATGFNADVSRFQTQLPAPQGESFAVVADDPRLAGGLEFATYAREVSDEMQRLGYAPASPETASLLVRFDYGVDKGREKIRSTGFSDPFYSPWVGYRPYYGSRFGYGRGFGRGFYRPRSSFAFGYYDPWFSGSSFGGNDVTSYTVYTSGIDMKIDRASTGERLFEGKAQAMSTSNRLQYLVPNLVDAMFTDFPGNSGETLRISIKPEETTVRRLD